MPLNKVIDCKEIIEEADNFEKQFKDPKRPRFLLGHITAEEILSKLGFRHVKYDELDPDLKRGLEKSDRVFFCAHPLDSEEKINPHVVIMQNVGGTVVYFIQGEYGEYAISRAKRTDLEYLVHELGPELSMDDVLEKISYDEIKNAKTPQYFDRYEGGDIKIPLPDVAIAEKTRQRLRSV